MKFRNPRNVAFIVALSVSSISGIVLAINYLLFENHHAFYLIASVVCIFVVSYLIASYILHTFVMQRLKPIYDTISIYKLPDEELSKKANKTDIFTEVSNEVANWVKDSHLKAKEIIQLKANEQYRKEFLGNVSHELKTPIFNIQGYILTLMDGAIYDEAINQKYLKRTEQNINRLITIVNDLETISRLESGELKLDYEKFDFGKLAREVLEMQEILAKPNNIKLTFQAYGSTPNMVWADKKRIFQVLTNLVVNSIKYGHPEGETIVRVVQMNPIAIIEVEDNGIGIPDEHLPRIFERFYRVDKSRSREMGGTGLGLSIVKHIVEGHNQRINVKSTDNVGTVFTFTLDVAK